MAVLPRLYAARLRDVVEVPARALGIPIGTLRPRSLYFVVHRKKRDLPRIRAVAEWLDSVFA
jgi:DNA-binding transcriptional LysR family regulator